MSGVFKILEEIPKNIPNFSSGDGPKWEREYIMFLVGTLVVMSVKLEGFENEQKCFGPQFLKMMNKLDEYCLRIDDPYAYLEPLLIIILFSPLVLGGAIRAISRVFGAQTIYLPNDQEVIENLRKIYYVPYDPNGDRYAEKKTTNTDLLNCCCHCSQLSAIALMFIFIGLLVGWPDQLLNRLKDPSYKSNEKSILDVSRECVVPVNSFLKDEWTLSTYHFHCTRSKAVKYAFIIFCLQICMFVWFIFRLVTMFLQICDRLTPNTLFQFGRQYPLLPPATAPEAPPTQPDDTAKQQTLTTSDEKPAATGDDETQNNPAAPAGQDAKTVEDGKETQDSATSAAQPDKTPASQAAPTGEDVNGAPKDAATTAGTSDAQPAQGDSNDEAEKTGVDPTTPAEASDQGALTRDEKNETLEDTTAAINLGGYDEESSQSVA